MTAARINVDGRKYTVVIDDGKLSALRYGEPWRDLSGDNLVYWLAVELQAAREALAEVNAWAVCGAITTPEDMAQNLPRIVEITTPRADT